MGLYAAMKPERVGLFEWADDKPRLRAGLTRSGAPVPTRSRSTTPSASRSDHARAAQDGRGAPAGRRGRDAEALDSAARGRGLPGRALPGGPSCARRRSTLRTSRSSEALATQVALALDRARLTEQQRQREEQERQRLLAEVAQLRTALQRTQIIYRSSPHGAAAGQGQAGGAHGRDGAGDRRERHRQGAVRARDAPAEPASRPAVRGRRLRRHPDHAAGERAVRPREGRLHRRADRAAGPPGRRPTGGTLLARRDRRAAAAMRRAGSCASCRRSTWRARRRRRTGRIVDVRVIAATNRDLQAEVAARRRFRGGPLPPPERGAPRDRRRCARARDDVLHLANHFCTTYALMYGRPVLRLSPDAEAAVMTPSLARQRARAAEPCDARR